MTKIFKKNTYKMVKEFWTEVATKTRELESLTYRPTNSTKGKEYISKTAFIKLAAANEKDLDGVNRLLSKFKVETVEYK